MHYLQLFITKHTKKHNKETIREEAINLIEQYLELYQDIHFDWYQIGGRWEDIFSDTTVPYKEAENKLNSMLKEYEKEKDSLLDEVKTILNTNNKKIFSFSEGYKITDLGKMLSKSYYEDSLIFNIEQQASFTLPSKKELENKDYQYYVTVVDIHN